MLEVSAFLADYWLEMAVFVVKVAIPAGLVGLCVEMALDGKGAFDG